MYTENAIQDAVRFAKASASNLVARFAPAAYVRWTEQTGRGAGEGRAEEVADYFLQCFDDYRAQLGLDSSQFESFLRGKRILEYVP